MLFKQVGAAAPEHAGLMGKGHDAMAPHTPFAVRLVLANRWLFDPLLEIVLAPLETTNAMLRTTTAASGTPPQ